MSFQYQFLYYVIQNELLSLYHSLLLHWNLLTAREKIFVFIKNSYLLQSIKLLKYLL